MEDSEKDAINFVLGIPEGLESIGKGLAIIGFGIRIAGISIAVALI